MAGADEARDLGRGTAAAERGISGANRGAACRLGGIHRGGGRCVEADLWVARSQGASVFYISQADLGASAGALPAEGSAWAVSGGTVGWGRRRLRGPMVVAAGGPVQKTGSLAAALGWE